MTREEYVAAVLAHVGTPYHHQGRLLGVGVDCIGLCVSAAQRCGYAMSVPHDYDVIPSQDTLLTHLRDWARPIPMEQARPGDLLVFRMFLQPQHLAVIVATSPLEMVHTYQSVGRVVRSPVDQTWRDRLVSVYCLSMFDE